MSLRRLCFIALLIVVCQLYAFDGHALTVSAELGVGSAQSQNEISDSEGPFAQAYSVEYLQNSFLSLGVEHLRSLDSKMGSTMSFSGLLGRYYINSAPTSRVDAAETTGLAPSLHDISVFVGTGMGAGQSSSLSSDSGLSSNAAGFYLSPRAGCDYQMTNHLGIRAEFIYSTLLVGSGRLSMFFVGGGLYYTIGG